MIEAFRDAPNSLRLRIQYFVQSTQRIFQTTARAFRQRHYPRTCLERELAHQIKISEESFEAPMSSTDVSPNPYMKWQLKFCSSKWSQGLGVT